MNKIKGLMEGIEAAITSRKEDVGEMSEGKKTTHLQISKAAKMVVNEAKWNKELQKLGIDTSAWDEGYISSYVFPILVAIVKGQGGDVDAAAMASAKGMLKAILKSLVGSSNEMSEGKKVTHLQITKAAKMVTNEAKWNKELQKLGLDPSKWDEGAISSYVFPVIVAIVNGQGGTVDNAAMASAKGMLKAVLKSIVGSSKGDSEGVEESDDEDMMVLDEANALNALVKKKGKTSADVSTLMKNALALVLSAEAAAKKMKLDNYNSIKKVSTDLLKVAMFMT